MGDCFNAVPTPNTLPSRTQINFGTAFGTQYTEYCPKIDVCAPTKTSYLFYTDINGQWSGREFWRGLYTYTNQPPNQHVGSSMNVNILFIYPGFSVNHNNNNDNSLFLVENSTYSTLYEGVCMCARELIECVCSVCSNYPRFSCVHGVQSLRMRIVCAYTAVR